jgi:hypothetical protein
MPDLAGAIALALPVFLHLAPHTQSPAPAPPRPARESLAPFFARANADPTGVVPLILAGSAAFGSLDASEARLLADTLEPYCRRAFFAPERLPGMEKLGLAVHTVRAGEVPEKIARHCRIGAGMLRYLNKDFDERRLHEGQELKVLDLSDAELELVVEKSLYRLAAWRKLAGGGRALVEYVPVGLGAPDSPTPIGRTSIVLRSRDPDWTDPVTRQVYKAGDPRNVLGGYWIGLDGAGIGRSGIGLHGFTGDAPANWIEQPASHGCVRMLQSDIDRVFHLAIEGTPVSIEP